MDDDRRDVTFGSRFSSRTRVIDALSSLEAVVERVAVQVRNGLR